MDEIISSNIAEQKYRVLIDNAPEPVFIFDAETFKFVDFNQNALDLFIVSAEKLYGMGPDNFSPDLIYGENVGPLIVQYISEALQGGNPAFDWIHIDSKGKEFPCEVRLVRFPPYDKKLVRASVIDRSENKKLEAALKEREERLELALNATKLGTFDMDVVSGEVIWDKRMHEIIGLPYDSIQDRNEFFFSVIHPEDRERVMESFVSLMGFNSKDSTFQNEYRIYRNGEVCHIVTKGLLIRNEKGEVLRSIGTCYDNTESKRIQEKLRESEERFSKSFYNNITPMLIFNHSTGERMEANKSFLDLIGYTEEEDMQEYESINSTKSAKSYLVAMKGVQLVETNAWESEAADIPVKAAELNLTKRAGHAFIEGMKAYHKKDAEGLAAVIKYMELDRNAEMLQVGEKGFAMCSTSGYANKPSSLTWLTLWKWSWRPTRLT